MKHLPVLQEQALQMAAVQRTQVAKEWLAGKTAETTAKVSCRKGCASCCYHPVFLTVPEALTTYRQMVKRHLWTPTLRDRLKEVSDLTLGLSPTVWSLACIPCPLLDGANCSIYQYRPFGCRTTISVGDPHYCHPHRFIAGLTAIQDRQGAQQILRDREAPLAANLGLPYLQLPLAAALTLAYGWHQGDQTLENFGWNLKQTLR